MQSDNLFLADLTKVFTSVVGTAQGIQKEAIETWKQIIEQQILNAGFVKKEEFDALEARVNLLSQKLKELQEDSQ